MNGLIIRERATFVRLADGKFLIPNPNGATERTNQQTGAKSRFDAYDAVQGHLTRIEAKDGDYGKQYLFWFDTGIVLALKQDNMTTQSLINALASIEIFGVIEVSAYAKEGRTSVYVKNNGQDCKWRVAWENQPKAEPVLNAKTGKPVLNAAGKPTYDTEERVAFFDKLVSEINTRLQGVKVDEPQTEGFDW